MNENENCGNCHRGAMSTWLVVVVTTIVVTIVCYSIFLLWKTKDVNKTASTESTATETVATNPDETADWNSYTFEDLLLSMKYPKEWGDVSIKEMSAEAGSSKRIVFSSNDSVTGGWASSDFTAGRSGYYYETGAYKKIKDVNTCALYKKSTFYDANSFVSCKDLDLGDKKGYIVNYDHSKLTGDDLGESLYGKKFVTAYYFTGNETYPVLGIEGDDDGTMASTVQTILESIKSSSQGTADWKTYGNTRYSYSIKYPSDWYISNTSSEKDYSPRGVNKDLIGGDTAWSNYNKFGCTPGDCPTDLKIINLMVYKYDANKSISSFVDVYGYNYPGSKVSDFKTESGLVGKKYLGAAHNDSSTAINSERIFFQNNDQIFIFNLSMDGIVNSTEQIIFENMIKSFQFAK